MNKCNPANKQHLRVNHKFDAVSLQIAYDSLRKKREFVIETIKVSNNE